MASISSNCPLQGHGNLVYNLIRIKTYTSERAFINAATRKIPVHINEHNVIDLLNIFNNKIASDKRNKRIISPLPRITSLEQLEDLEQQLNDIDHALGKLWQALPIAHKPRLNTISQIEGWFEDENNQELLQEVISLDLESCEMVLLPIEILKLPNLTTLNLYDNKITNVSLLRNFGNLQTVDLRKNPLEVEYVRTILPHVDIIIHQNNN